MIPDKEVEIAAGRLKYWTDKLNKAASAVWVTAREGKATDFESALAQFSVYSRDFVTAFITLDNLAKEEVEKRAIEASREQNGGAK